MNTEPQIFTTKQSAIVFEDYASLMEELNDGDMEDEYLRSMYDVESYNNEE